MVVAAGTFSSDQTITAGTEILSVVATQNIPKWILDKLYNVVDITMMFTKLYCFNSGGSAIARTYDLRIGKASAGTSSYRLYADFGGGGTVSLYKNEAFRIQIDLIVL